MISVLLDMACLVNSIQEKRFWFQIHWCELKLCSQRWRAWRFLPQQTLKRTGLAAGGDSLKWRWEAGNTRRWPLTASKKQPCLCVTFRMLNIAQVRGPILSAPGGSEPPLKVGSHLQTSHTSLNSKPFSNYQPGQRTEAPLSNIPGVISAPLALPAVLSENREGSGGREWKGTDLSVDDLLARQRHPYLSWFRTIKWDAFCLSASCCSRKGFPVPCCHKLTGNFTLLIPYSFYECSLALQISLQQRKQLLTKLSLLSWLRVLTSCTCSTWLPKV